MPEVPFPPFSEGTEAKANDAASGVWRSGVKINAILDYWAQNGAPVTISGTVPGTSIFGSVTTSNTGTNYTALSSQEATSVTIINDSGTSLEFLLDGAGTALRVPSSSFYTFSNITNANQLSVRRVDTSNTQVTITYEAESQ